VAREVVKRLVSQPRAASAATRASSEHLAGRTPTTGMKFQSSSATHAWGSLMAGGPAEKRLCCAGCGAAAGKPRGARIFRATGLLDFRHDAALCSTDCTEHDLHCEDASETTPPRGLARGRGLFRNGFVWHDLAAPA
jgi:hypothetical protein